MKIKNQKKKRKYLFLIISLSLFIFSVSFLYYNRFNSYINFKKIQCYSSGATISANLFLPKDNLEFQGEHPLVFFVHGLGSQKDLDPRIPIELTKRGFFVASIDYRGSGESTGGLLDMNYDEYHNRTNIPAIAQDCSKLLDKIETLPEYSRINSSQIGIVGHSFGGMVALMNSALDNRFKAIVTWAGLVNFSASLFGISESHPFMNYIPAKIINITNPQNLLVIHSIFDTTVPYEKNALVAKNLTNCSMVNITHHILGGPHFLLVDEVLVKTINWFEQQFFNSITINGPIRASYIRIYVLLFLTLFSIFLTTIAIMVTISKYIVIEKEQPQIFEENDKSRLKYGIKNFIIIFSSYIGIIMIWFFFIVQLGIPGLFLAPAIIILIILILSCIKHFVGIKKTNGRTKHIFTKSNLIKIIKSYFKKNIVVYPLISAAIFLILYFSVSISFPFGFFSPINFISFILAYGIYPFYLVFELYYRKIVYDKLDFIRSPLIKLIIVNAMGIFHMIFLMLLAYSLFLIVAFMATFFISLVVMLMNSLIYEKTKNFGSVLISSFLIIQIFFCSAITSLYGFGSLINLL
ncbi:MAG: alpha/beta fold hydrolase [Candidatus Lokiarchaeota archaeon]|nr:alpha/beta fold hydrolase [Candidatus Lokiarchaeota archaeon]